MTLQRKDIDIYAATADRVNHTVLIGDATTPFALKVSLQRLWLAQSREWMLFNVLQQCADALHDFHVTRLQPIITVLPGLLQQDYFHRSSMSMGWKFPSAMSFSPWRTISSNSAIDIRFSSLACFWEAIRLSDLTAFFIRPSSPDIVWRAPKSSALSCICTAVIKRYFCFLAAKIHKTNETTK